MIVGPEDRQGLDLRDEADVVIVGSGAAGATAARVLTEAGLEVVIVEEGPHVPTEALRPDFFTGQARVWRDGGAQLARGPAPLPLLQGVCVGGSTAINGAIIHRIPERIIEGWQRADPDLADWWTLDDLERIWDTMDRELGVSPAPESVLGRNNLLFAEAAARLGVQANAIRRNVIGCEGAARCVQGCPTARRQSMNVSYIPRALRSGARLYTCAWVDRISLGSRGATGVVAQLRGGARRGRLRVGARRAVLVAASAVQTPLLLLRSGLGRTSGLVGRRFQAHPGAAVLGVFDAPVRMWSGATQGYESLQWWDDRMKLETLALPPELGAARLPAVGPELKRRLAEYGHVAQWAVQVRARAMGTVVHGFGGRAVVRYAMTREDVRTMKVGIRRLCELMFAAGAREVLPGVHGIPPVVHDLGPLAGLADLPDSPKLFHGIVSHMFGTAVMASDPSRGVTRPDGRLWDCPGVHVIDSSLFPSNLGVNPQHAIAGLAWRIAEHLIAGVR